MDENTARADSLLGDHQLHGLLLFRPVLDYSMVHTTTTYGRHTDCEVATAQVLGAVRDRDAGEWMDVCRKPIPNRWRAFPKRARRVYVDVAVARMAYREGLSGSLTAIVHYKAFNVCKGGKVPKKGCMYYDELRKAARAGWVTEDGRFFWLPTWKFLRALAGGEKTARVMVPPQFFGSKGKYARLLPYYVESAYYKNIPPGAIAGDALTEAGRWLAKGFAHSQVKGTLGMDLGSSSRSRGYMVDMGLAVYRRVILPCERGRGHYRLPDGSEYREHTSECVLLEPPTIRFGKPRDPGSGPTVEKITGAGGKAVFKVRGMRFGDLGCP